MRFHVASQIHVPFGPDASGGSEEYHIELARRLAARGHNVVSYAPLPQAASRGTFDGVAWRDITEIDASAPGFWILQRDPSLATRFAENTDAIRRTQCLAFACHDFDYPIPNWAAQYAVILADSEVHARFLRARHKHPNVITTGVGPCLDRADTVPDLVRKPKRLIWASSYVRGLECLLQIYERALEWLPDLELQILYGWESIDVAIPGNPGLARFKENLQKRISDLPGVSHVGRVARDENVWAAYSQAGLWVYPTEWPETGCQAAMLAQAFGAIPIATPHWALSENVRHGQLLYGFPYSDRLVRARFTQELLRLASNPAKQDEIRSAMMSDARAAFGMDKVVDRVEAYALAHDPERVSRVISIAAEERGEHVGA